MADFCHMQTGISRLGSNRTPKAKKEERRMSVRENKTVVRRTGLRRRSNHDTRLTPISYGPEDTKRTSRRWSRPLFRTPEPEAALDGAGKAKRSPGSYRLWSVQEKGRVVDARARNRASRFASTATGRPGTNTPYLHRPRRKAPPLGRQTCVDRDGRQDPTRNPEGPLRSAGQGFDRRRDSRRREGIGV